MGSVERVVRTRAVDADPEDIAEALNRELSEVVRRVREETNRLTGDFLTTDEDVTLEPYHGVVICTNTSAITVTLPAAADVPEKRVLIIRTDAAVAVASDDDVHGSSSQAVTQSMGVLSSGSTWWIFSAS